MPAPRLTWGSDRHARLRLKKIKLGFLNSENKVIKIIKGVYPLIFVLNIFPNLENSCWLCIHFWIKWDLGKMFDTKLIGWTPFRLKIHEVFMSQTLMTTVMPVCKALLHLKLSPKQQKWYTSGGSLLLVVQNCGREQPC